MEHYLYPAITAAAAVGLILAAWHGWKARHRRP